MRGARNSRLVVLAGLLAGCPSRPGETTEAATTSSSGPTTGSGPTTTGATADTTTESPTTGGAELTRCESHCESDRDCLIDGVDQGFRCLEGLCKYPACANDTQCQADLSGWKTPCLDPQGCKPEEVCVDVEGFGRCALAPGSFQCADFGLVELMLPTIDGMRATVCGQQEAICEAGECAAPCVDETSCPPQSGHPFCDVESGACECQVDQDCLDSQLAGFVRCVEGRCACATDDDCAGGQNVDTCFAGVCGCSSDASCSVMVFDGAPLSCQ